jgi:hypothetical protein
VNRQPNSDHQAHFDACLWCAREFERRRGGSPQRFCGPKCRTAFWTTLRRWGDQAIADGVLTIAELKNGTAAACTLLQRGNPAWAVPNIERNPVVFPDPPLRFLVEVNRSLVSGLAMLGLIRPDERGELAPILGGMKRLGWLPHITRIG